MATRMECKVCCNTVARSRGALCPLCGYEACRTCVQTYLLSQDDPQCMSCRTVLTRPTLLQMVPEAWVDGSYAAHHENVLLQHERSLLPSTQPHVERQMQQEAHNRLLDKMRRERAQLMGQLQQFNETIRDVERQAPQTLPEASFFQRCARTGCNGYLDSSWTCHVCKGVTCAECGVFKLANHVCSKDDKDTVQALRECRPCPSCHALTQRVSGCSQMWCLQCKKSWDWDTGRRIHGAIHNPERQDYEWRVQNGMVAREPGDIPCAGRPTARELVTPHIGRHHFRLGILLRLANTLESTHIRRYETHESNLPLRIALLRGRLDEPTMRRMLGKRDRRDSKNREIAAVLETLVHSLSDLLRQVVMAPADEVKDRVDQMNTLVENTNEALLQISKTYRRCHVPQFMGPNLRIVSAKIAPRIRSP